MILTSFQVMQLLESGNYRNDDKLGKPLSKRENEIVRLMLDGFYTRQLLAKKLYLSEHTIRNNIVSICDKLNVDDTTGIVLYAIYEQNSDTDLQLIETKEN